MTESTSGMEVPASGSETGVEDGERCDLSSAAAPLDDEDSEKEELSDMSESSSSCDQDAMGRASSRAFRFEDATDGRQGGGSMLWPPPHMGTTRATQTARRQGEWLRLRPRSSATRHTMPLHTTRHLHHTSNSDPSAVAALHERLSHSTTPHHIAACRAAPHHGSGGGSDQISSDGATHSGSGIADHECGSPSPPPLQQQQQPPDYPHSPMPTSTNSFHNDASSPPPTTPLPVVGMEETAAAGGEDCHRASDDSEYETYACEVDRSQSDRSAEIALFSFDRPHMRAFHLAWMSFFVAFFTWCSITPLLSEVKISLHLSKQEIWTSSICGVAGTAVFRVLVGPVCDRCGPRWVMGATLFLSGIPTLATGFVHTSAQLSVLRLFTGLAGSTFVTCQYWTSTMFTREVAGTANALVAGWGNLGGGVTQIVMGSALFPLFKWFYRNNNNHGDGWTHQEVVEEQADRAWRTVCIIPAALSFATALLVVRYSDDSPKGNTARGCASTYSVRESFRASSCDANTWILAVHYACSFGVELTMINAGALYFKEVFGQSTESAAAIASIFGWMNLFARGLGGFVSDITNANFGMRGRLIFHVVTLTLEGIMIIAFSHADTLAGSICTMIVFSLFVQSTEGSTFSIVPYVNPSVTGSISGLIGAGGNVGGVLFAVVFRQWEYRDAFFLMGWAVIASSIFTVFISIRGHAGFVFGRDSSEVRKHFRRRRHESICNNTNTAATPSHLGDDTDSLPKQQCVADNNNNNIRRHSVKKIKKIVKKESGPGDGTEEDETFGFPADALVVDCRLDNNNHHQHDVVVEKGGNVSIESNDGDEVWTANDDETWKDDTTLWRVAVPTSFHRPASSREEEL